MWENHPSKGEWDCSNHRMDLKEWTDRNRMIKRTIWSSLLRHVYHYQTCLGQRNHKETKEKTQWNAKTKTKTNSVGIWMGKRKILDLGKIKKELDSEMRSPGGKKKGKFIKFPHSFLREVLQTKKEWIIFLSEWNLWSKLFA